MTRAFSIQVLASFVLGQSGIARPPIGSCCGLKRNGRVRCLDRRPCDGRRFTDYLLPDADGVSVLDQVNRSRRVVPVIIVSGSAEIHGPEFAAAPFAHRLLKPIDPWRLADEMLAVLARPQRRLQSTEFPQPRPFDANA
jgi:DNA-binding NtrC family response regulator